MSELCRSAGVCDGAASRAETEPPVDFIANLARDEVET